MQNKTQVEVVQVELSIFLEKKVFASRDHRGDPAVFIYLFIYLFIYSFILLMFNC